MNGYYKHIQHSICLVVPYTLWVLLKQGPNTKSLIQGMKISLFLSYLNFHFYTLGPCPKFPLPSFKTLNPKGFGTLTKHHLSTLNNVYTFFKMGIFLALQVPLTFFSFPFFHVVPTLFP